MDLLVMKYQIRYIGIPIPKTNFTPFIYIPNSDFRMPYSEFKIPLRVSAIFAI